MSKTVNIAEAKATLSGLIDEALAGEEIIIARAGKPQVMLTVVAAKRPRTPGAWKRLGIEWPAPDEPPSSEEQAAWRGELTDEYGLTKGVAKRLARRAKR